MQDRKIRDAIFGRHHDLAVDDRRTCVDVPGIGRDLPKAIGPVVAASSEDLDRGVP